jgi:predicted molibdopterin-dependent oxidoreductase YjgC
MTFGEMVDAAIGGALKALIVVGDNPLLCAPDRARVEQALAALDLLIVIADEMTDTAKMARVVLADVPAYAKTGTFTSGDRRVSRLHAAMPALGDARPALLALTDLAGAIGDAGMWSYAHPDAVTDEIAERVPGYEAYRAGFGRWSMTRASGEVTKGERQPVADVTVAVAPGSMVLTTTRTLFTSLEGAEIHSPEADKLHREEFVEIHPADAVGLRVNDEDTLTLVTDRGELEIRCKISGRVLEGVLHIPQYYDGGAVMRLLGADGRPAAAQVRVAATAAG